MILPFLYLPEKFLQSHCSYDETVVTFFSVILGQSSSYQINLLLSAKILTAVSKRIPCF